MDIGTSHLAVVLPSGSAGDQAVTKIYKASQSDKGEENGLLETYIVSTARFFLQNGALPDLGSESRHSPVKKYRSLKESSPQFYPRPKLTVDNSNRPLKSQCRAGHYQGIIPIDPATGVDSNPISRDTVRIDIFSDINRTRI